MTIRYFCDGCGEELGHSKDIKVNVGDPEKSLVHFEGHLCDGCRRSLIEKADPRKWPRAAVAAE